MEHQSKKFRLQLIIHKNFHPFLLYFDIWPQKFYNFSLFNRIRWIYFNHIQSTVYGQGRMFTEIQAVTLNKTAQNFMKEWNDQRKYSGNASFEINADALLVLYSTYSNKSDNRRGTKERWRNIFLDEKLQKWVLTDTEISKHVVISGTKRWF